MSILFESTPLLIAGVFVLGALIGSFLNVVILRLPVQLEFEWRTQCCELLKLESFEKDRPPNIVTGGSMCPNCQHKIRAWENIPLISYLLLKGKCAECNTRISIRYPVVELLTAILFSMTIWVLGPTIQGATALVLTGFLIALTGIDLDHQLLPDNLTIPLMWAGIAISFWSIFADLTSSVLGAIFGYLVLWIVYHVFRLLTGKEGMGHGDFKLMAALGAWMGWQFIPLIILLSSIVGAIVGLILIGSGKLDREKPMPFGPFIAGAGWIALLWGNEILAIYTASGTFD